MEQAFFHQVQAVLEVGFHVEYPKVEKNEAILQRLLATEKGWRRTLGIEPIAGVFLGANDGGASRRSGRKPMPTTLTPGSRSQQGSPEGAPRRQQQLVLEQKMVPEPHIATQTPFMSLRDVTA